MDSPLCLSEYRPRTLKVSTCPGESLASASCGRCYCDLANYTLSSPSSMGTDSPTIDPVEMPDIFFPSLPFSCGYPCDMVMDNMKYREVFFSGRRLELLLERFFTMIKSRETWGDVSPLWKPPFSCLWMRLSEVMSRAAAAILRPWGDKPEDETSARWGWQSTKSGPWMALWTWQTNSGSP